MEASEDRLNDITSFVDSTLYMKRVEPFSAEAIATLPDTTILSRTPSGMAVTPVSRQTNLIIKIAAEEKSYLHFQRFSVNKINGSTTSDPHQLPNLSDAPHIVTRGGGDEEEEVERWSFLGLSSIHVPYTKENVYNPTNCCWMYMYLLDNLQ